MLQIKNKNNFIDPRGKFMCLRLFVWGSKGLLAVGINDFLYLSVFQQRERSLLVLMIFHKESLRVACNAFSVDSFTTCPSLSSLTGPAFTQSSGMREKHDWIMKSASGCLLCIVATVTWEPHMEFQLMPWVECQQVLLSLFVLKYCYDWVLLVHNMAAHQLPIIQYQDNTSTPWQWYMQDYIWGSQTKPDTPPPPTLFLATSFSFSV